VVEVAGVEPGEPSGPAVFVLADERHVARAAGDDAAGGLGDAPSLTDRRACPAPTFLFS
jgi:hypothetical protein